MSNESDNEKTYRSYGGRVVSDNLVVSFNIRFLINIAVALAICLGTLYTYENRLREVERSVSEHNDRITELIEKHIAEESVKYEQMQEELKWYQKELNLNPLSKWRKKK